MVKRAVTWLVIVAVTLPGCAAPLDGVRLQTSSGTAARTGRAAVDPMLLADYVQKLPIGSRVRVYTIDGRRQRGTLMDANADRIVIQPRTRIPEPPVQIPLEGITAVELDHPNGSVGRAVGVGIAAGAGAILAFFLILAAVYAD